eukprot:9316472-Alexandrium_andersonii.AAC.1
MIESVSEWASERASARACVRAWVHACPRARARACVHARPYPPGSSAHGQLQDHSAPSAQCL